MNSDDMNDAEFEAFLKGEDPLSRQLQSLAQPAPSAALDAAILGKATLAMARQAANDPAPLHAVPPMRRLGRRWTIPAGIAATLLVGVLARHSWETGSGAESIEYRPKADVAALEKPPGVVPESAPVAAPAAPATDIAGAPKAAPPALADTARAPIAPNRRENAKESAAPAAAPQAPAVLAESTARPVLEAAPVVASPALAQRPMSAPPPPPAPLAAAKAAEAENVSTVLILGARASSQSSISRKKQAATLSDTIVSEDTNAQADARRASEEVNAQAEAWLARIDEMLKAGMRTEALEEWSSFRLLHPAYPVSNAFLEKISAARK